MHKWKIGDRFSAGGHTNLWFQITHLLNDPNEPYLVMYNSYKNPNEMDGNVSEMGPYLGSFRYLGNFSKSSSFQSLYEKLSDIDV